MKKNIINLFLICMPLIIIIILALKIQGFGQFTRQISMINPVWILLAVALMGSYWLLEAGTIFVIIRFHKIKAKYKDSIQITMLGQFFNAITPFNSGGQPAQVLGLVKKGVDAGKATSIIVIKFVVYQLVFTVYAVMSVILILTYYYRHIPLLLPMVALGLLVHVMLIGLSFLFSYNQLLTEKIILFIFRLLRKIKILKIKAGAETKLEKSLENFHQNAAVLKQNKKLLFKCFVFMFLQLACYFSIPFFIYVSFGHMGKGFFEIFFSSVLVSTIIAIVPLPGAIGGAEGSFYLLLGSFFNNGIIFAAILLWRMITYYLAIILGGLFLLISKEK